MSYDDDRMEVMVKLVSHPRVSLNSFSLSFLVLLFRPKSSPSASQNGLSKGNQFVVSLELLKSYQFLEGKHPRRPEADNNKPLPFISCS